MIGDKFLFDPIQEEKARIIFKYFVDNGISLKNNKLIIGIGGASGTNKSEIAIKLREILKNKNIPSYILHGDDYYKVHYVYRKEVRKKTGIIGQEEMNWRKINQVFEDFKNGKPKLYTEEIDIFIEGIIRHIVPATNLNVLIFEGLYACYSKADVKVYLEGSIKQTYKFRKDRGKEDPDDEFRKYVLEREYKSVVQSKKYADLIIPFEIGVSDDKK